VATHCAQGLMRSCHPWPSAPAVAGEGGGAMAGVGGAAGEGVVEAVGRAQRVRAAALGHHSSQQGLAEGDVYDTVC
jgi:hypothetical protein